MHSNQSNVHEATQRRTRAQSKVHESATPSESPWLPRCTKAVSTKVEFRWLLNRRSSMSVDRYKRLDSDKAMHEGSQV
jgi:hypothetical protein